MSDLIEHSPKLWEAKPEPPHTYSVWMFYCPGCKCSHGYHVGDVNGKPGWTFNGNIEKPSFMPSLLCNASDPKSRCHLHVTDGMIRFEADCHHELAGKTVAMEEI